MIGYSRGFQPMLWAILGGVFVSGLLLIPGALELRLEWDLPWRLPQGQRLLMSAVHALFAFLTLTVLGALLPLHMRAGWRRHENRKTGLIVISSMAFLSLSALVIYYVIDERISAWASLSHWLIGLSLTLPLALHVWLGRDIRRSRRHRPHHPYHPHGRR